MQHLEMACLTIVIFGVQQDIDIDVVIVTK